MSTKIICLSYSILIMILGALGFLLTGSFTSLIGPAMVTVVLILSLFIEKNPKLLIFAQIWIALCTGLFGWRFNKALQIYLSGNPDKLISTILLGLMGLGGVVMLFLTLNKKFKRS